MATLARRVGKIIFFIVLMMVIGRLINPSAIVGDDNIVRLAIVLHGQANAENVYDTQFYIDFPVILILAIIVYVFVMKLIRIIRS